MVQVLSCYPLATLFAAQPFPIHAATHLPALQNTVCALTNLTFYMGPDNRLLHLPPSEVTGTQCPSRHDHDVNMFDYV